MKMMGQQVAAIGDDGGQRNLNVRVVNVFRNPADQVSEAESQNSPAGHSQQKTAHALQNARISREIGRQQDLKQHHGGAVIQQAFTFNQKRQPLVHPQVFKKGQH